MTQKVRVAVHGACGRMGRSIVAGVIRDSGLELVTALESAAHPLLGLDIGSVIGESNLGVLITSSFDGLAKADVVIDFGAPSATDALIGYCLKNPKAMVIGTTGLSDATRAHVQELSAKSPVVLAPNMSVGVNVLIYLARRATELLGKDYDIEMTEMHHRQKVDAPSGTALRLAQEVAAARQQVLSDVAVYGREGQVGPRDASELGVMTLRGGDVVGDHTVFFVGDGERVELTHRAHKREVFAQGALRAAHWAVKQAPGLYEMQDVLGLRGT